MSFAHWLGIKLSDGLGETGIEDDRKLLNVDTPAAAAIIGKPVWP